MLRADAGVHPLKKMVSRIAAAQTTGGDRRLGKLIFVAVRFGLTFSILVFPVATGFPSGVFMRSVDVKNGFRACHAIRPSG